MTVNHGGRLQPMYFKSYLTLIMSSHECSLDCAKDYTINTFSVEIPNFMGRIAALVLKRQLRRCAVDSNL
ncbi:hypothetical protein CW734_12760 [Planococcus sp. MB-3u-03]|nr:hypothetical protein CW734_12760 [Planococcus sp. MB-3u-03]